MMKLRRLFAVLAMMGLMAGPVLAASWNPGVKTLASTSITTAITAQAQTAITNLEGMTAANIDVTFAYGSGGTTAVVVIQTSFDGGSIWRDVAYFSFTTASSVKYANLSGLTAKGNTAYAALAADGVNDGLLGDQLRAVITTTGTYAATTITVRASVR